MDMTFEEEQRHLDEVYAKILALRDELQEELDVRQKEAASDLRRLSEELRPDVAGIEADEAMETLAAIETLNAVIDSYNQRRDFAMERMQRVLALLRQPYFAKVRLKMRPNRPPQDVYIGAVGLTDKDRRPLVVDWRSPVAETYYKQEMGPTSFVVDGRVRNVELLLRRQFDIVRDRLKMYFDTTVAIEDSLLLQALQRHHSEKLQAITATIQREQNVIVRHEDVDCMLVSGVAGSGKTSVMLQRIAYLFYQERGHLDADQVTLFTPNAIFGDYINQVLPSMGERNPEIFTWHSFCERHGLGGRDAGADADLEALSALEAAAPTLEIGADDVRDITLEGIRLLTKAQVISCLEKFSQFPVGPKRLALARDEMHERLERRISTLAKHDEYQEEMLGLDVDEQSEIFGETISPDDEQETIALTRTYLAHRFAAAHDAIDDLSWLRLDRLGSKVLGGRSLNATEWLWLRLLVSGESSKRCRYVMVDEVQDYTVAQLTLLSRFFSRAHFLLLGDENQAIREGTASFEDIRAIFTAAGKPPVTCSLRTSYRSSPEITELFGTLLPEHADIAPSSVRRAGKLPRIEAFVDTDRYLEAIRTEIARAEGDGLCAVIAQDTRRVGWLAKKLGGDVRCLRRSDQLPTSGAILIDLALAKGLEFDKVIVADASTDVFDGSDLSRRRLYTQISRAMHEVCVFAQGELCDLIDPYLALVAERGGHAAPATQE